MWPFVLVERIRRKESTKAGVWVPRRDQEETAGAKVFHPGEVGELLGIKQGDVVVVRPHCGHDFTLGGTDEFPESLDLTFLNYDKDEIFAVIEDEDYLVRKGY